MLRVSLSGSVSGLVGDKVSELPFLPVEGGCSNFLLRATLCSGLVVGKGFPNTAKGGSVLLTLDPWIAKGISKDSHAT